MQCIHVAGLATGLAISAAWLDAAPLPKIRLAPNGSAFVTEHNKPFVPLGVNYFRPGTGWAPKVWQKFDAAAARKDFAIMKDLGVNCVRIFLTYGSFCMEPNQLKPEGLEKFDQLLGIAEEHGIYIHPTGLDHWEGVPAWAGEDRVAHENHLAALEAFWRLFARRYASRSVIFAYDLRNEPSVGWDTPSLRRKWPSWLKRKYGTVAQLAQAWELKEVPANFESFLPPPPMENPGSKQLLDYQFFREEVADEWTRRQTAAIKESDPRALVTVGLIQWSVPALLPGIQHYSAFRPSRQASFLDFMEIHFYPLAQGAYEYRSAEEEEQNLAYLEAVVREVAAAGKPVVLAEFGWYGGGKPKFDGGRHPAATGEQQARWCQRLIETTSGLACGWLNWGLYDHPEARDVTELTGLLTADGQPKPWGRSFQTMAAQLSMKPPSRRRFPVRPVLPWERCLTSLAEAKKFRESYYQAFRAQHE